MGADREDAIEEEDSLFCPIGEIGPGPNDSYIIF